MLVLMDMKILHRLWLLLYVTNDIQHVWHRLVANLEMNSYNQLGYRITKCIAKLVVFMQNGVKLAPLIKPCMILGVIYFWFMMGKSS